MHIKRRVLYHRAESYLSHRPTSKINTHAAQNAGIDMTINLLRASYVSVTVLLSP